MAHRKLARASVQAMTLTRSPEPQFRLALRLTAFVFLTALAAAMLSLPYAAIR
jgi:hypothetical protein